MNPMSKALRPLILLLLATPLLGWGIGLAAGGPAGWSVAIGLALPILFFGVTAFLAWLTSASTPTAMATVVLGSWLAKIVVLIAFLAWLRGQDFYSTPVLFGTLAVGTFALLLLEAWVTKTTVE